MFGLGAGPGPRAESRCGSPLQAFGKLEAAFLAYGTYIERQLFYSSKILTKADLSISVPAFLTHTRLLSFIRNAFSVCVATFSSTRAVRL